MTERCRIVMALVAAACAAACAGSGADQTVDTALAFVTIRDAVADADPQRSFGNARGEPAAGICRTRINPASKDGDAEIVAVDVAKYSSVFSKLGRSGSPIVLYVHGYGEDFGKSCRRAALLQHRLRLDGRLLLFSWPANSNLLTYSSDVADLEWSVGQLVETIRTLAGVQGPDNVNVLAHSLGARGIVDALDRMSSGTEEAATRRIGELVLVAPDIDRERFAADLHRLLSGVSHMTIYVSEKDRVLKLSSTINLASRLGQEVPEELAAHHLDIVDLSSIERANLTGHVYHLFNPAVIEDLRRVYGTADDAVRYTRRPVAAAGVFSLEPVRP